MRDALSASLIALLVFSFGCSKAGKEAAPETVAEAPKETYPLDLHPRERAGARAKWDVKSEISVGFSVKVTGAPEESETGTASLEVKADVEILTVDTKGAPTGMRSTVRSSIARVDGQSVAGIPAGTVVESRLKDGQTTLTGMPFVLDPTITALAEGIFSGVEAEGPTDGDLFGTSAPRAIGDKWDINAEEIRKVISSPDFSAHNAQVTGTATLMGTANVNGTECLQVRATTRIKDVDIILPDELTLDRFRGTLRTDVFLDRATGLRLKDTATSDFEATTRGQPGVEVIITVKNSLSRTIDRSTPATAQ